MQHNATRDQLMEQLNLLLRGVRLAQEFTQVVGCFSIVLVSQ